ncbi:hypothetical protein VZQ01_41590 [Myxococcus faecalis]|uniref:hypothetical protein n=1 Tax=Myxococcus TaxID=32 RepID=UPI0011443443|nr:hypothetical protein [Myxococcus sp. AB025B]BDT34556.1 hypothetical protein MFMH1_42250 [Myxococcus sp. MH1]
MVANETQKADLSRVSQMMAGFLQQHGGDMKVAQRAEALQRLTGGEVLLSEDAAARAQQSGDEAQSAWTWTWPF